MENKKSLFNSNANKDEMSNTEEILETSQQKATPIQNPFEVPRQKIAPIQNPFEVPRQKTKSVQKALEVPEQKVKPEHTPVKIQGQEPLPVQVEIRNETWKSNPDTNQVKKKKNGLFVTLIIVAVVLLSVGVFNSSAIASLVLKKSTPEFVFDANTNGAVSFKLLEIKRGVKVEKSSITVYIFDAENIGQRVASTLRFYGISKDGAFVPPITLGNYKAEYASILKENNCKGMEDSIDWGKKERVCLGYPESVTQFLVPEQQGQVDVYRPVTIDKEASSLNQYTVERKRKGEAVSITDYEGSVSNSITFSDVREVTDRQGKSLLAIEATLLVEKDQRHLSGSYQFIQAELEDGTYYQEGDSDYVIDGTLSKLEFLKKVSEPVIKGDVLKYTITFPKSKQKIKNLVTYKESFTKYKGITSIIAV